MSEINPSLLSPIYTQVLSPIPPPLTPLFQSTPPPSLAHTIAPVPLISSHNLTSPSRLHSSALSPLLSSALPPNSYSHHFSSVFSSPSSIVPSPLLTSILLSQGPSSASPNLKALLSDYFNLKHFPLFLMRLNHNRSPKL